MKRIPINPKLPANFSNCRNEDRPHSHQRWWFQPYIETYDWERMRTQHSTEADRAQWFAAWPSGTRYDVRCLDGGAWDRPTCLGMFTTLDAALVLCEGVQLVRRCEILLKDAL